MNQRIRRTVAGLIMSVLAVTFGFTAQASAQPAEAEVYTCFVRTLGVPFYDQPYPSGGVIEGFVNQGQGFDVYAEDYEGLWRGGNLWGGPGGVWIHSHYLVC